MASCPPNPIAEVFSHAGLRCTRQRMALYAALQSCKQHPTAEELRGLVLSEVPGVSLATVYNTLDALCGVGLARRLDGAGPAGSARYDAGADHHPHMRCLETGKVDDLPSDLARQLIDAIPDEALASLEDRLGFSIERVNVELLGRYHNVNARS